MPFEVWDPFTQDYLDHVPEEPGVYRLTDEDLQVIYIGDAIGEGKNLRIALQNHFDGEFGECTQKAKAFEYEVTTDTSRKQELLDQHERPFGELPKCNQ